MSRKKIFLIVQAVLCALIAGLLAAAALRLYFSCTGGQAGKLFDHIYTREKAGAALLPVLPLFLVSLVMTVTGIVLGIRDENADKPVRDAKRLFTLLNASDAMPQTIVLNKQGVVTYNAQSPLTFEKLEILYQEAR